MPAAVFDVRPQHEPRTPTGGPAVVRTHKTPTTRSVNVVALLGQVHLARPNPINMAGLRRVEIRWVARTKSPRHLLSKPIGSS